MARVTARGNTDLLRRQQDFLDIAKTALQSSPEMPPICDFAEHPSYLGQKLYPRQKTLLKLMFLETENMSDYDIEVIDQWSQGFSRYGNSVGICPDVWQRIEYLKANNYNHFREIVNITGRRGGKGHIGGIIGAYLNWRLIQLDDPQWFYGVASGHDMYLFVVATNIMQAKQYQFADLVNAIIDAPCFQPYIDEAKEYRLTLRTPADIRRIAQFEARGIRPDRQIASIRNQAVTSNSKASRGAAAFAVMFDEMAHMLVGTAGPRTSDEVYNAITPALDQFQKDGMIYIPTSPYTKLGRAYDLYEAGLTQNQDGTPAYPDMLIVQLPSWGPYEDWQDLTVTEGTQFRSAPQTYDEAMKRLERREPEVFKVERMSQWAEVVDAYLNPKMVERMFDPFYDASGEKRYLEEEEHGIMVHTYRGHCDPSKSECNTAVVLCHVEKISDPEDGEEWFHIVMDWCKVWKPEDYPDHQIDYEEVEEDIVNLLSRFPTTSVFSYDQYGGFVTLPRLKKRLRELKPVHKARVHEEPFTSRDNQRRAERFKSALGQNWVHAYRDNFGEDGSCLLADELKFLQEQNGKIVKQNFGPVQTKDLADAFMVCVDQLLEDNFLRLQLRERLGNSPLGYTAQGGYHTQMVQDPRTMTARQKLQQMSNSRIRQNADYSGMSHRKAGRPGLR